MFAFLQLVACSIIPIGVLGSGGAIGRKRPKDLGAPNVIMILADDLGYGDLGFAPFSSKEMKNIKTPELDKMARRGMTLTNFHTASPVCSPSRASIMVGLFPWRMGVDFIYAGDLKKDGSEEMDHEQLPLIPNIATSFHDAGYYTAHIGKWHLGGQTHLDIPRRLHSNFTDCSVPGINQYGFDEYVGMSEGTGSMRYITHQARNTYATGSKYLIRNDVPIPPRTEAEILTDRQTSEAIKVMETQVKYKRPFFLNLWFDAPHSPWEKIEPFFSHYDRQFGTEMLQKYASMISNMDMNIGRLLASVDALGIAENTLIFFTSDNGPENDAGFAGPFKGRKRLLAEGGIRVPALAQWKGKIIAGSTSDKFVLTTDLFPTFLQAAKVRMPQHIRIDGVSMLPMMLGAGLTVDADTAGAGSLKRVAKQYGDERVVLWYTHSIGFPKLGAAWSNGFKILWNDYEGRPASKLPATLRLYDMRRDPTEDVDLLPQLRPICEKYLKFASSDAHPSEDLLHWSDLAHMDRSQMRTSASSLLKVLQLFNHLHIKMHLFRHDGEGDWMLYHKNKPYENDPACYTRKASAATFPWSSHVLAPEFCGESLFAESGTPFCRCAFPDCNSVWQAESGQGWTQGPVFPALNSFAPPGSSLQVHLGNLLEWSRFSPLCSTAGLVVRNSTAIASLALTTEKENQNDCGNFINNNAAEIGGKHEGALVVNGGWARGDVVSGGDWSRGCHQRVHKRGRHLYVSGTSCGRDAPVFTLAHKGMQSPLPLCPESLTLLQRTEKPYFDDNALLVVLNDILMDQKACKEKSSACIAPNKIGILDPLLFHNLLGDSSLMALIVDSSGSLKIDFSSVTPSYTEAMDAMTTLLAGAQAGFFTELQRRLGGGGLSPVALDLLVMPVLHKGSWSVALLCNLEATASVRWDAAGSATSQAASQMPYILFFDPLDPSNKMTSRSEVKAVTYLLGLSMLQRIRLQGHYGLDNVKFESVPTGASSKQLLTQKHESGARVILFVKAFLNAIAGFQDSRKQHAKVSSIAAKLEQAMASVTSAAVSSELAYTTKDFIRRQTEEASAKKKYLNFMSATKYPFK